MQSVEDADGKMDAAELQKTIWRIREEKMQSVEDAKLQKTIWRLQRVVRAVKKEYQFPYAECNCKICGSFRALKAGDLK